MEGVHLDLLLFTKSFYGQTAGLLSANQPIHSFLLCHHHLIFDKIKNQLPDQKYAVGGRDTTKDLGEVHVDEDIAISPLATPLIAGPGSIATAMGFVSDQNWIYMGIVILMYGLVCLLHYIAFSMGEIIIRRMGYNIIAVIGKIMGLIIAVIGTGMVIQGIEIVFS